MANGAPQTRGWDETGRRYEFMKMQRGNAYRVRFVGPYIEYYEHFSPGSPICGISPGEDQDVVWQRGYKPRVRWAAWVIDRNGNVPKIMKFGVSVKNAVTGYAKALKRNPSGAGPAPDWIIDVVYKKAQTDEQSREYQVTQGDPVALTEAEVKVVEDLPELQTLPFFQPLTPKEVEELFNEAVNLPEGAPAPGSFEWRKARRQGANGGGDVRFVPDDSGAPKSQPQPQAPRNAEASAPATAAASADEKTLFGDDDGDGAEDSGADLF